MLAAGGFGRFCNRPTLFLGSTIVLSMALALPGHAEPGESLSAEPWVFSVGEDQTSITLDELRLHASTIGDILDIASERVERLAVQEQAPDLVAAIRHELSLSRRWNQHLASILLEVAEARRELGVRERQAAAEIAQLTAVAEKARLELVALKKALSSEEPDNSYDPEQQSSLPARGVSDAVSGGRGAGIDAVTEGLAGPYGDLDDAQATLTFMYEAQEAAVGDVEVVRAKIIDALHTVAAVRGDQSVDHEFSGSLSSEDITAWAASMASKLHEEGLNGQ